MPQARSSKVADVALVLGGGDGLGRAVALTLAAKGIPVVVEGANERDVARVVGEITCGGGAARHIAGELGQPGHLEASIARPTEAFGGLRYVILTTFDAVLSRRVAQAVRGAFELSGGGRLVIALAPSQGSAPVNDLVKELSSSLEACGATARAFVWDEPGQEDLALAGEVVAFLCNEAEAGDA